MARDAIPLTPTQQTPFLILIPCLFLFSILLSLFKVKSQITWSGLDKYKVSASRFHGSRVPVMSRGCSQYKTNANRCAAMRCGQLCACYTFLNKLANAQTNAEYFTVETNHNIIMLFSVVLPQTQIHVICHCISVTM